MISVVIRAKDESAWLRRCLGALTFQSVSLAEVVAVDNQSRDSSRSVAEEFGCRLVSIEDAEFTHGKALNRGISACSGELVALLSAHCIPVNDRWLERLAANFSDPAVAGVYGRQEPLPDSHDFDKRDLWTTFGVERRVQRRDQFFHNANAMIRRSIWQQHPFNEALFGLEDRVWAQEVLAAQHVLVYEPAASVYHYHGIHQGRDERRAERVVRVIELLQRNGY